MKDDQLKELLDRLERPHRIQNKYALFRACEEAAVLIKELIAKADEPEKKPAAKKPVSKIN